MLTKEFYTVEEMADYLSLRPKTLYAWAEKGKIPAYKIQGALRFNLQEIKEFLESQKLQAPSPSRLAKIIVGKKVRRLDNHPNSGQGTPR